jgi:hypothetical protein
VKCSPGASGSSDFVRTQIADNAVLAGIAPGPPKAIVEHRKKRARFEIGERFGVVRWAGAQGRGPRDDPVERLGVMRGDYSVGERPVGKVAAVGVAPRVRQV